MKLNIRPFFISLLILLNLNFITSPNTTDCVNMYFNNTITTPCINNMTCCYIEYSNFNSTSKKCLLKKNYTENLCPNLGPAMSYFGSSLDQCDCMGYYLRSKTILIILLVILIN